MIDRDQKSAEINMARKWALVFGVVGYLLVLWRYVWFFAPVNSVRVAGYLEATCPVCYHVTAMRPGLTVMALTWFGPINALLFAIVAYLIARTIDRSRARQPETRRSTL